MDVIKGALAAAGATGIVSFASLSYDQTMSKKMEQQGDNNYKDVLPLSQAVPYITKHSLKNSTIAFGTTAGILGIAKSISKGR